MRQILWEWNPWWEQDYHFSGIPRAIASKIQEWIPRKEIIAVLGVRRSGKTTLFGEVIDYLLHQQKVAAENILFIKADDERVEKKDLINSVLREYYRWKNPQGKVFLFIDEIQEIEGWEKTLKRLYDLEHATRKMFISGSNAFLLREELSSLLVGRFAYFEVYPFSFAEFLRKYNLTIRQESELIKHHRNLSRYLVEYLSYGGFPEVVLEENISRKEELLRFYFDSIVFRDVIKRQKIRNPDKLTKLIEWCLQNIAVPVNFTKLGEYTELTTDSVGEYAYYLEQAYLVFVINLFAYSLKKQYVNPKKLYAVDPGLRRRAGFTIIEDKGRIYENAVFLELKRRNKEIYYWKNEGECDFVLKEGLKIKGALQVCSALHEENEQREIAGLLAALHQFNLREGIIITQDVEKERRIEGKRIHLLPLWKWLLQHEGGGSNRKPGRRKNG